MEPLNKKAKMIEQLKARGIDDERVLEAFNTVPREEFVLPVYQELAYSDQPLEIGLQQTISQPYIVALMLQEAGITPHSRVLDIGTGSGYAAAVASRLASEVHTIEILPKLSNKAKAVVKWLGYNNIHFNIGDGRLGLKEAAPFDAILVAACSQTVPKALLDQLAINGHFIIPIGKLCFRDF